MTPLHSGAVTLPRGFRYQRVDNGGPRTPEPFAGDDDDARPPSPPRPRLRLKRRNASNLNAPTLQFLASVAAADVPLPSIEDPELAPPDEVMVDTAYPVCANLLDLEDISMAQKLRGRAFSPPRTPAPGVAPSLSPRRYPDWTIDSAFSSSESSPECESSRPSTARSTQTSASLFSRFSLVSDDQLCISPDHDGQELPGLSSSTEATDEAGSASPKGKRVMRKAPWTKAMSQHLWSTYSMYLQDPRVTPFRTGKSGIPPHGVCLRVAREAKRSWKGSKPIPSADDKSGSSTPIADTAGAFIQWPHTCASTRAHLRELCRVKATSSAVRNHKFLSHSPTPFGRTVTRHWNRRSTPLRSPSVFSAQDMAMSLTISTADSMQPQGPLAQLTSSAPEPSLEESLPAGSIDPIPTVTVDDPFNNRRLLGAPFIARSYGPSSSAVLGSGLSALSTPAPHRQTHTVGPRRNLQSPVRLARSRSNTQKRRTRQLSHEPRKSKRPSLVSDMWTDPSTTAPLDQQNNMKTTMEYSSTTSGPHDELFIPRTNIAELLAEAHPGEVPASKTEPGPATLAPASIPPRRLGSPFSAASSSFSFPNRSSQPGDFGFGAVRRPFATVQQSAEGSGASSRPSLATRLAYIDQRLREFRQRDQNRRRSQSPL